MDPVANFSVTNALTSGTAAAVAITPTYNQATGTAANTDLLINRTETHVGSGPQLLIDAQVGGTSIFKVDNAGAITGIGSAITGLNATNISSGTINAARFPGAIEVNQIVLTPRDISALTPTNGELVNGSNGPAIGDGVTIGGNPLLLANKVILAPGTTIANIDMNGAITITGSMHFTDGTIGTDGQPIPLKRINGGTDGMYLLLAIGTAVVGTKIITDYDTGNIVTTEENPLSLPEIGAFIGFLKVAGYWRVVSHT